MKRLSTLLALILGATCLHAAELVPNPQFAQAIPANATVPQGWTLAPDSGWALSATEGPDGRPCLKYGGRAAVSAPARLKCLPALLGVVYQLQVTARSDGGATPVVRVMDLPGNKELASLVLSAGDQWETQKVTFKTESESIGLEFYADATQVAGGAGPGAKLWVAGVSVQQAVAEYESEFPKIGENLALTRPYTMKPAPNYSLCADADDKTQLTDGIYTKGHFWTQKTTVGWGNQNALITIDLGQDYPIKGLSFNTAAGVAQVKWPKRIFILLSSDGENWYEAGNLVALNEPHANLPEYGQFAVRRLWTDQLQTHGRYVALFAEAADSSYIFVDEIEVYRGDDSFMQRPYKGVAARDPYSRLQQLLMSEILKTQFQRALKAVREDLAAVPAVARPPLEAQADKLVAGIADFSAPEDMTDFRAVLPVNDLEASIFRLQAAVWRAQGKPALRVWSNCRWDMLEPSAEPATRAAAAVDVHLMNNEWRAGVVNLTNAGDVPLPVRVKVTGLPGGDNPSYLRLHEALTVGTRRFVPVTAALPELKLTGGSYTVTVPPGMTRQLWLSFKPDKLTPKTHTGQIVLTPEKLPAVTVPLKLNVYPVRFPDQTSLILGGWDYTDSDQQYGITLENREAVIAHLKEHYVNGPWASSATLGGVSFNPDGSVKALDTTRFDTWVKRWPQARMYLVFLAVGNTFSGEPMGTEAFNLKVGNWMRAWKQHMLDLDLKPSQLGLLIYDEPQNKAAFDIITHWARAIEAAVPEFVTWEDPQPLNAEDPQEMFASVDVLCPYRNPLLAMPDWYRQMYLDQQQKGKELWIYNADGPARTFDPFSFYLVQEWHCFQIGAKGSCFWAFGDNGGVSCWNEYPAKGNGPYCPSYLDQTSVTTAKYMEAIREGVQDYEYLTMLQKRVVELEKKGVAAAKLAAARKLLSDGPRRVMAGEVGSDYRWDEVKDRTVQDTVRIEILRALTDLQKL